MGGGISVDFRDSAPSPGGSGQKSVVSDPIEDGTFSVEKFWDTTFEQLRSRGVIGLEKDYQTKVTSDGGLHVTTTYPLPGYDDILSYSTYHIDKAKNISVHKSYVSAELNEKNCVSTNYLKIYQQPIVFEWWNEEPAGRRHGYTLLHTLAELISGIGSKARVSIDMPSLSDPGEFSVVTDPIEDCDTTATTFIPTLREILLATGGTLQPDGSYTQVRSSWLSPALHLKYSMDEVNNMVSSKDYGWDAAMMTAKSSTFLKVHSNPFRLEAWTICPFARRSGHYQKELVSVLVKATLKKMEDTPTE